MVQLSDITPIIELDEPQSWDLSDLYQGFNDPQLAKDLELLQQSTAEFRQQYRGKIVHLSPAEIAECLQKLEAINQKSGFIYSFHSLNFAVDTRNTEAKQFLDKIMELLTAIDNQLLFFDLELQEIELSKFSELPTAIALANYTHYLKRIADFRPHKLTEEVEQTRNQDNLTGRQAFIQLRSIHLGEQEYPSVTTPEGKVVNTEPELAALMFHQDAKVRYDSYIAIRQVLKQHNSLYGYILNTIAQDHRIENQLRGYSSTLHKQLISDQVSEPVFQTIMEGTASRFDLFQRYYQLKSKTLNQKIRICDIYAPWGTVTKSIPSIDYKTGITTLLSALEEFDVNYAHRAEEFFLKNWVDAKVRPGKRSGAFCAYSHGLHSYLFLSYTNDYNSLFTLAHEMGHGLHCTWIDQTQSYFNSNPPLVLAEIASTFNELLLLDYLLKDAVGDTALTQSLITRQLEDQFNLLFRQSTISRLELAIHTRANEGSFDHKWVNEEWLKLYQQICGDVVELLPEHQYDWAKIGHIYFQPFYCYQYTASNVVSLACYQKYLQTGKDFIPGYLELLAAGGGMDQVAALRRYVGVDIEDPKTIVNALNYVEGLLDQLQANL